MGKGSDKADKDKGPDKADKDKGPDKADKDKVKGAPAGEPEMQQPPGAPDETLRRPPHFRRGHRPAPTAELRQKWQRRRADHLKRRRASLQKLREEWGEEQLLKPAVRAAIKVHTWRTARLKRIRELAQQDPDGKDLVEKVDKLAEKEDLRFRRQMARLKTGSDVGVVGDAGVAPPVAPPPGAADKQPPATAGKKEGAK